jgi:hypothetical protein
MKSARPTTKNTIPALALVAITIFLGAFLLFQVQPIMGKYILPWFGGSPGVWTTCMLLFQILLFGGYAYAHALHKWFTLRQQTVIHGALLLTSLLTLPIEPDTTWKPDGNSSPVLLIMGLLLCKVGAPYFLLSSTGPLLQSWLAKTQWIDRPYRLYSLSNVGSMLALLSYPFAFEPALSSPEQSYWWAVAFIVYVVLCTAIGCLIAWHTPRNRDAVEVEPRREADHAYHSRQRIPEWLVCAAIPSALLLATTNQVCQDTAVVPFLWVAPLAIYLLSFILTFDSDRWYSRRPCIQLAAISFMAIYVSKLLAWKLSLPTEIGLYFSGLFFSCMVCHGELAHKRPAKESLTLYYLTISAGGALGGILVGLLAPALFTGFYEFPLMLLSCMLMFMSLYLQSNGWWRDSVSSTAKWSMAIGIPVVAVVWLSFSMLMQTTSWSQQETSMAY